MSEELMLVGSSKRPAIIFTENTGRIYISVHDDYFRETQKQWKLRMKMAHPDMVKQEIITMHVPATTHMRGGNAVPVAGYIAKRRSMRGSEEFRRLKAQHREWLKEEISWYAQYNLEPPQWGK